jgi:hypothetical protein
MAKSKVGPKILPKIMKIENIAAQDRRRFNPKRYIYANQDLQGMETIKTSSHSLDDRGDLSLLCSLL